MSVSLSKKTTIKHQTTDSRIEALQDHLLKSLSTAFDPTSTLRSDDNFLAQDYNQTIYTDPGSDSIVKHPYQALAERARTFVEKAEADRPLRPKVKCNTKKKSDTFVTYLEVEGSMGNRRYEYPKEEPEERYTPLAPITYDNILMSVSSRNEKTDDLEELRRMIKKTKRNINAYGRELISLKKDVVGVNDYAARELGYGANNDLMYNVENAVNLLKRGGEFKPLKNKNVRGDENGSRFSKIGSVVLNSSGTANKRTTSVKGSVRKW